uniref:uncharacterized protein LOC124017812 isoform X2 n=1 Tax=Oncorhynchus gorbuscha TaxID=8017 RepID=UPI001EAEE8B1|nr:uncharacterized protein LOC124017812 isoform X2 [Oncorhynchus gorbuscha]
MNFRSCLSVAVIWFLSSSQLSSGPHLSILYLSVTRGSVTIPITDGWCPESDFGLYTERKGPVVTYENNVPTEGPNYLGRIQLMNISNGCTVVIHNVTKEDTETVYYTDGLPGQLRIALKMTNSTEGSITIAAAQPSSTTPGGSIESSASQPSTTTSGLHVEQLAGLVSVGGLGVVVVVVVVVVVCIRKRKNKLKEEPPLAELQVLNQNASKDTAEQ